MRRTRHNWRMVAGVVAAAAIWSGCGKEGGGGRAFEAAERYFAAGDYVRAEIEYRNVLEVRPRDSLVLRRLGAIWLARGAGLEAAGFLARASELAPGEIEAERDMARALLVLGLVADARQRLAGVLDRAPGDEDALVLDAETALTDEMIKETRARIANSGVSDRPGAQLAAALLAMRQGDRDGGEKLLRRVLERDPRSLRGHSLLAQLEWSRERIEAAEAEFKKVVELAPARSVEALGYAVFLDRCGRRPEAVALLEERTRAAPDFLPAWRMLGRLAWDARDVGRAQEMLEKALAISPRDAEAGMLMAQVHLHRGAAGKALDLLGRIREVQRHNPALEVALARAHLANRDRQSAGQALERALQLNPGLPDALLLQAGMQLAQGAVAEAIAGLERVLAQHPGHPPARWLMVDALRAAGRYDEAVKLLTELATAVANDFRPHYHLGLTFRMQGDVAAARRAFERAHELAPEEPAVIAQLVAIELQDGDHPAARRRVDDQLAKHPEAAQLHFLSGIVCHAQGSLAGAERALRKAVELDPGMVPAHELLVRLLLADGRSGQALGDLQRILDRDPANLAAQTQLAMLQQQLGRNAEARDSYQRILATHPEFVPALNNMAILLGETPDGLERAGELAARARTLAPEDGAVADTHGWIQYRRKEFAAALVTLRQAAERLPEHPVVQYHLGVAAAMMGRVDEARAAFTTALSAAPEFAERADAGRRIAQLDDGGTRLDVLEERLRADPADVIARLGHGRLLTGAGRHAEAAAAYQEALRVNPELVAACQLLAELYLGPLDDTRRALEFAGRARELAPRDPRAAAVLGRARFRAGDHEAAYSLLREATTGAAVDRSLLHDLAWAAYSLGRVEEARTTMQRAVDASGGPADAVADARAFIELTQPGLTKSADAGRLAAEVLRRDPGNVAARMAAGDWAAARQAWEEAAAAYRKVLESFPRFAPARVALAAVYVNLPDQLAEAERMAVAARETLPDDLDLSSILARIRFRMGEFEYAAELLGEVATKRRLAAGELFVLGIARAETGRSGEARAALEQALAAGLPEAERAQAAAVLDRLRDR